MGSETSPLSQLNDSFPGWLHTKWRQQLFFSVFSTCIRNNIYFAEEFEAEILIIRSQSRGYNTETMLNTTIFLSNSSIPLDRGTKTCTQKYLVSGWISSWIFSPTSSKSSIWPDSKKH